MAHIPYRSKDPTFEKISERLMKLKPGIDLGKHIDHSSKKLRKKIEIGPTTSEGVYFVPRDPIGLRIAIRDAKNEYGLSAFHYDDRKVWAFRLAAAFTHGAGFREIGSPSLHCAIASDICNIHIDDFGFVAIGNNGKSYFTLDSLPHIADELVYRAYIRKYVRLALVAAVGEQIAAPATLLLDRSYLALPTLDKLNMHKLTNQVDLRVGGGLKIAENDTFKFRFESTCGNTSCSDNRHMFTLGVDVQKLVDKLAK